MSDTYKYSSQTPFIASYMIFRNEEGKLAFILRSNTGWMNGYYTFPSGKVENGEFYIASAVREAEEEVGAVVKAEDAVPVLVMHRIEPDSSWVDVFFEAAKWEGEVVNNEPHMHGELVWFDPKDLPEKVLPNVKFALEQIEAGNMYCEFRGDSK